MHKPSSPSSVMCDKPSGETGALLESVASSDVGRMGILQHPCPAWDRTATSRCLVVEVWLQDPKGICPAGCLGDCKTARQKDIPSSTSGPGAEALRLLCTLDLLCAQLLPWSRILQEFWGICRNLFRNLNSRPCVVLWHFCAGPSMKPVKAWGHLFRS